MSRLGDTLRERRTTLGFSVEQVQEATRIRAGLIVALESGDWAKLPNPGYVRGYISSYARFLELDPMPLLAMYKAESGAGRFHELNLPHTDEAVAPSGQQHAVPVRTAIVAAVVIALISVSVWAVTRIWRGPEPTLPEPAPLTETTPTADTSATSVKKAPAPAVKYRPFTLEVAVDQNGASWVKVTVDGNKAYEGTLTGGQAKRFEVTKSATVLVGQPSAVTILRDGKPVDVPPSKGTPKVTLTAEKIE